MGRLRASWSRTASGAATWLWEPSPRVPRRAPRPDEFSPRFFRHSSNVDASDDVKRNRRIRARARVGVVVDAPFAARSGTVTWSPSSSIFSYLGTRETHTRVYSPPVQRVTHRPSSV